MNHAYPMDYINDKATYKAVMFACDLLKKGEELYIGYRDSLQIL